MQIDLQLIPIEPPRESLSSSAVVVIDVLRATSVMVMAIFQGARELVPVRTVEEAFGLARSSPAGTTLLGGERGGKQIEGFDLGNSPREYTRERIGGKRLIVTTTNGTKALHSVSSAREVLVGSFFNVSAIAGRCLLLGHDLLVFPSGSYGKFSLEDTVCGGMIIDLLLRKGTGPIRLSDAALSAHILYQKFENSLSEALHRSSHGKDLISMGLGEDLPYCARPDITDLVPVFRDGVIRAEP